MYDRGAQFGSANLWAQHGSVMAAFFELVSTYYTNQPIHGQCRNLR